MAMKLNWKWTLLACAMVLSAGCAVLTVDVDVYKGPLANEESLQVEQLGAMAMAAKPLLASLRDSLEFDWNERAIKNFRAQTNKYRVGYMEPRADGSGAFANIAAIRLNAVLSLYEDRDPTPPLPKLAEARDVFAKYQRSHDILIPTEDEKRMTREKLRQIDFDPQAIRSAKGKDRAKELLDFLLPEQSASERGPVRRKQEQLIRMAPDKIKTSLNMSIFSTADRSVIAKGVSTVEFEELELEPVAGAFAKEALLAVSNNPKANHIQVLTKEIQRAARSFRECREAAMKLREISMEQLLITAEDARFRREKDILSQVISLLTRPELVHAIVGLQAKQPPEGMSNAINFLKQPATGVSPPDTRDDKLYRDFLSRKLSLDPLITIRALRDCDSWFKYANENSQAIIAIANELKSEGTKLKTSRQYGLAVGPNIDDVAEDVALELTARIGELSAGTAGLAHGRVNEGINHLVDHYLAICHKHSPSHHSAEEETAREQMLQALIGFAQKLKTLGDFEVLSEAGQAAKRADGRSYVALLQATGNSILSLVDEMRHRQKRRPQPTDPTSILRKAESNARTIMATLPPINMGTNQGPSMERLRAAADLLAFSGLANTGLSTMTNAQHGLPPFIPQASNCVFCLQTNLQAMRNQSVALLAVNSQADAGSKLNIVARTGETNAQEMLGHLGAMITSLKLLAAETNTLQSASHGVIRAAQLLPAPEPLTTLASTLLLNTKELAQETATTAAALKELEGKFKTISASSSNVIFLATNTPVKAGSIELELAKITLAQDSLTNSFDTLSNSVTKAIPNRLSALQEATKSIQNAAKEADKAVREMKESTPVVISSLRSNFLHSVEGSPNTLSALDTLLEQIRLMHIASVASGETALAENLKSALEQARSYRAGQVFIRPPSAYLRNSYATSSAQEGTDTSWNNKLLEHGLKSLPLSTIFHCDADGKVRREIDKQNWQNINKVKVSAAVTADYVIVKDDIGNWYVKGFSADSGKLIEAARAMGLYAGGASLASGILSKTTNAAGKVAFNEPTTLLDRQRGAFEQNYNTATSNQLTELATSIQALKASVLSNWNSNTNLTNTTAVLVQQWEKLAQNHALTSAIPNVGSDNDQILARLGRLRAFRDDLKAAISSPAPQGVGVLDQHRPNAIEAAVGHIDARANEFISRRLETVHEYENALRVLGKSASNN